MCLDNSGGNNDTVRNLISHYIYYSYRKILFEGRCELKKMLKEKKYNDRIAFLTALKSSLRIKVLFVPFVLKAYNVI